jgi:hypothetical protein
MDMGNQGSVIGGLLRGSASPLADAGIDPEEAMANPELLRQLREQQALGIPLSLPMQPTPSQAQGVPRLRSNVTATPLSLPMQPTPSQAQGVPRLRSNVTATPLSLPMQPTPSQAQPQSPAASPQPIPASVSPTGQPQSGARAAFQARLEQLQQQRLADEQAMPDPNAKQFRPSIGRRLLRGLGEGLSQQPFNPAAVNAPVGNYSQLARAAQNRAAADAQQIADTKDQEQQADKDQTADADTQKAADLQTYQVGELANNDPYNKAAGAGKYKGEQLQQRIKEAGDPSTPTGKIYALLTDPADKAEFLSNGTITKGDHPGKSAYSDAYAAEIQANGGKPLNAEQIVSLSNKLKDRAGRGGGAAGPKEADARAQAIVADADEKKQNFADDYTRNDDGSYSSNSGKPDLTPQQFQDKIDGFRVASNKQLAGLGYTVGPDGQMAKVGGTPATGPAPKGVHPNRTPPPVGKPIMVDGRLHNVVGYNQKTGKPIVDPNPQ